jgi:hypothetical protein
MVSKNTLDLYRLDSVHLSKIISLTIYVGKSRFSCAYFMTLLELHRFALSYDIIATAYSFSSRPVVATVFA